MKILVYVEGPSDRDALCALLRPVIEAGRERGIGISFHPQGNKDAVLDDVPRRAADHLADRPDDWVVALPDLYPMSSYAGARNAHASFPDLEKLLRDRFDRRAETLGLPDEVRQRFRVHCLKHDLEVLLLAAADQLRLRLGTKHALRKGWRKPVEDQDDDRPPKRVVEDLFKKYRKKPGYVDTMDAPWILERADLAVVEKSCPQRFGPLVTDLRTAIATR
ncbi:MAG: DUF4276 family protein [Deltaproteobacteria bacterium]|nr:DUF4276 family protein [Deltaproteobacteria bacterium]